MKTKPKMTAEDLKFKEWLEAQPDDRVFPVDNQNCPLSCYGREMYGMVRPCPGYTQVHEKDFIELKAVVPSAEKAVWRFTSSGVPITAKRFRQLYDEGNQPA